MKIKPYTIEQIKLRVSNDSLDKVEQAWLLAWAHERAAKLELEHRINQHNGEVCDSYIGPREWLVYVLDEIGWDKKEMG